MAPEISGRTVIMKIFRTHRFQKKRILIPFRISAQIRCDSAFNSLLASYRKIQIAIIFRILQCKSALLVYKLISSHLISSCYFISPFSYSMIRRLSPALTAASPALFITWLIPGFPVIIMAQILCTFTPSLSGSSITQFKSTTASL